MTEADSGAPYPVRAPGGRARRPLSAAVPRGIMRR